MKNNNYKHYYLNMVMETTTVSNVVTDTYIIQWLKHQNQL